jgi:CheY-like chemotaxis protein
MNFGADKTSGEQGVRLFRSLREADPDLPILLITAWVSLETAVSLVKEGAADYMAKPWDDDKLVTTVRNLLEMRRLRTENRDLQQQGRRARQALAERYDLCGLVYESESMHRIVSLAVNVSGSDAPILLTGPSGAGKEKLAEIVQANSRRHDGPFIRVNVGALPEDLMEGELFGSEPGAYTGAKGVRAGRFEAADGGTLFLDEIDALPLSGQVKLLRVVQSGEYQRLGSSRARKADVRLISATNSDIHGLVDQGRFREDLFYRLNVIELQVPPLDRRPEDILPLATHLGGQRPGAPEPHPPCRADLHRRFHRPGRSRPEHRWSARHRGRRPALDRRRHREEEDRAGAAPGGGCRLPRRSGSRPEPPGSLPEDGPSRDHDRETPAHLILTAARLRDVTGEIRMRLPSRRSRGSAGESHRP